MIYAGIRILVVIRFNGYFISVPRRLKSCYGYKIFLLTLLLLVGLDKRDSMTMLLISLWEFSITIGVLYITVSYFIMF